MSFIKIRTIAAIGAFDIIDTVELVIWGAAESAVTIVAATIPILRALFRDFKPPPARFASDEESMVRRLDAASLATAPVATAMIRTSRSDLELIEWKDRTLAPDQRNGNSMELWSSKLRDAKFDPRREDVTVSSNAFSRGNDEHYYSGANELSRRLG